MLIPDFRCYNRHKPTMALYYDWNWPDLWCPPDRRWFEPIEDEE